MSIAAPLPVEPPAELRFRRAFDLPLFVRLAWRSRTMARALSERELRARYKQAALGLAWAFAAPLGYVLVFTIFFDHAADIETFGRPYVLFSYAALIPWGFFAQTMNRGSGAVLENLVIVNKIACPRETFVMAAIATAIIDSAVSALAFPVLVLLTGESFYLETLLLVPVLVVQVTFAAGFSLLVGSVLMYVRDVRHLIGLTIQLLMFATPVVWSMESLKSSVSDTVVHVYSFVNPMGPVCESYRRALVYGSAPEWDLVGLAALSSTALLAIGYYVFKKLEPGFADVA